MSEATIRAATAADVDTILSLIRELAAFERDPDAVVTTREDLLLHGFGERPVFEVLLAEVAGEAIGMALFFVNYSTWEGRPGLYLEDLYVKESARGTGAGRALMHALAEICRERGYARLDLVVLDWNQSAREFYEHLGMTEMSSWRVCRLKGERLQSL